MTADEYSEILDQYGGRSKPIERRERWRLLQQWRESYAVGLQSAKGQWKFGGYEWHVFSFGHAPAFKGRRAVDEYVAQASEDFVVCPERESLPAMRIAGGMLPDFRAVCDDVYVWPKDLSWCMAFTHEESMGQGPYFSRAEWVAGQRAASDV